MKRILPTLILFFALVVCVSAQDIPLFTQKLTNSFIYNPALAGHTFGSITYAYRQNYSNVPGAPQNHFLSFHAPFAKHKFGTGFNLYQEDVNFIRNTYASGAFAYHLHFNKFNILSAGVSAEYNVMRLNGMSNTSSFEVDPVLSQLQNGDPTYDFSFGMNYQTRYVKTGFAINRLSTAWINKDGNNLSNYFSGYVQGMIPIRSGDDMLEPYIAFRKFSETNDTYDIGLYYTYNNKIIAGAAMRKGQVFNATLGIRPTKKLTLGYSREMIGSSLGGFVGAANEISIRFDFNDQTYKERFRADYKNALAYRRKTLSPEAKYSARNPKQLKSRQKKLTPYSPNNRYQNVKKLSMNKKVSAPKKKSYNNRKSPVKKGKIYNPRHKKKAPSRYKK
ncbi:MAG: PorP/SprF family type IX secretion system membrane protein [Cyclobacteriaceae bacterium]|nr:PorP/SprF family type IX secretion system membrane protein [Cyclobacteriaceae bacterium]